MVTQKLWCLGLVAALVGNTTPALASHSDVDAVSTDAISVSGCGTQSLTFSGTASYSEPTQHLVVVLDGTTLFDDHSEPESWSTGPHSVGVGDHTFTATIYDKSAGIGGGHETIRAEDAKTFTVPSCTPAPAPSDVSGGTAADTDCCPGQDEPVSAPTMKKAATGSVKAAATGMAPAKLKWLNETFRKVYGRNPTAKEWHYWSSRLLTDKTQYDALYGAMQWHQLRGHTIGI